MNKWEIWFAICLPVYFVGAWTISDWLYEQVISGIHQYEIYKWRKQCQNQKEN